MGCGTRLELPTGFGPLVCSRPTSTPRDGTWSVTTRTVPGLEVFINLNPTPDSPYAADLGERRGPIRRAALPLDLGDGLAPTADAVANAYAHVERGGRGGWYPVGANTLWHGGVHLRPAPDDPDAPRTVHTCLPGRVVAARLGAGAEAEGPFGSRNFVLVRHEVPAPARGGRGRGARACHPRPLRAGRKRPGCSTRSTCTSPPSPTTRSGPTGASVDLEVTASNLNLRTSPHNLGDRNKADGGPAPRGTRVTPLPAPSEPEANGYRWVPRAPPGRGGRRVRPRRPPRAGGRGGDGRVRPVAPRAGPRGDGDDRAAQRAERPYDGGAESPARRARPCRHPVRPPVPTRRRRRSRPAATSGARSTSPPAGPRGPGRPRSTGSSTTAPLRSVEAPGEVDRDLLHRLAGGAVVALDRPVAAGDVLWTVGTHGLRALPDDPLPETLHWEVFSETNLLVDLCRSVGPSPSGDGQAGPAPVPAPRPRGTPSARRVLVRRVEGPAEVEARASGRSTASPTTTWTPRPDDRARVNWEVWSGGAVVARFPEGRRPADLHAAPFVGRRDRRGPPVHAVVDVERRPPHAGRRPAPVVDGRGPRRRLPNGRRRGPGPVRGGWTRRPSAGTCSPSAPSSAVEARRDPSAPPRPALERDTGGLETGGPPRTRRARPVLRRRRGRAGGAAALTAVCRFASEWGIADVRAAVDALGVSAPEATAAAVERHQWWDEARAAGVRPAGGAALVALPPAVDARPRCRYRGRGTG